MQIFRKKLHFHFNMLNNLMVFVDKLKIFFKKYALKLLILFVLAILSALIVYHATNYCGYGYVFDEIKNINQNDLKAMIVLGIELFLQEVFVLSKITAVLYTILLLLCFYFKKTTFSKNIKRFFLVLGVVNTIAFIPIFITITIQNLLYMPYWFFINYVCIPKLYSIFCNENAEIVHALFLNHDDVFMSQLAINTFIDSRTLYTNELTRIVFDNSIHPIFNDGRLPYDIELLRIYIRNQPISNVKYDNIVFNSFNHFD